MAKRKVVWTSGSKLQFLGILEYFRKRNKSSQYSKILYADFKTKLRTAAHEPGIGIQTEIEEIRDLITGNYMLFYEIQFNKILVLEVWDTRRNPEKLIFQR